MCGCVCVRARARALAHARPGVSATRHSYQILKLHLGVSTCACQCDPHLLAEDVHAATAVCANACAHMCACMSAIGSGLEKEEQAAVYVCALVATVREGPRGESPERDVPDFPNIHP